MQTVVIVIHLMIVAVLIGAVLLQKSEGGGLGMGGGAGFMSSRGTANLLTRTTAVLAVGFFITSLFLSWLASYERKPSSIVAPASPEIRSMVTISSLATRYCFPPVFMTAYMEFLSFLCPRPAAPLL